MKSILLELVSDDDCKKAREKIKNVIWNDYAFEGLFALCIAHFRLINNQMIEIDKRLKVLEERDRYSQFQKLNKDIEND